MGTDIHLCIEARPWHGLEFSMEWVTLDCGVDVHRNYDVFKRLAGVRLEDGDGITPIASPRGLPSNLSPRVAEYFSAERTLDGIYVCTREWHDASWLYWEECEATWPYSCESLMGSHFSLAVWARIYNYTRTEQHRLIFAFDS